MKNCKYKVGTIICWHFNKKITAEIIEITNNSYIYNILTNPNVAQVPYTMSYKIDKLEEHTSPISKLERILS